jgi:hypothetical protein
MTADLQGQLRSSKRSVLRLSPGCRGTSAPQKAAVCPGDPAGVRLGNPTAVAISVGGMTVSPQVTPDVPYHLEFQ